MKKNDVLQQGLIELNDNHESVKGTRDYLRFTMETYVREEGQKTWTFVGWRIPNQYQSATYIKRGMNVYIYQGHYRYTMDLKDDLFHLMIVKSLIGKGV